MFSKVLIANRGEVAVRIARACRELGASPVAVYSDADRTALHVRVADEAYRIGPPPSTESYLNIERVLEAAQRAGADAVHPGYGFLSENATFAQAVVDAGLTWVGPGPNAIDAMGDKVTAREIAVKAGVPVVPGSPGPIQQASEAAALADEYGYPVLLKAAAGGGGKGMRRVDRAEDLANALERAMGEAKNAFGDESVYVEKYLREPRHIEVQILADESGNRLHLFERECTIQRRHQKVIEECPSPVLDEDTRGQMTATALKLAEEIGYVSAGTVEFLVDADGKFYFLEMNTRLQVEHPVTEAVTGIDLVKGMLRIADGQTLPFGQDRVARRGHALECRIYAEDPSRNFMPSPGRISAYRMPAGPGVRVDGGVYAGYEVPMTYDPMIAKVVTFGLSRQAAIRRMSRALNEYTIGGIKTTIPLFLQILEDDDFNAGRFSTHYLAEKILGRRPPSETDTRNALIAAAVAAYERARDARALPGSSSESASQAAWSEGSWRWYHHRRGFGRS